MIKETRRIWRTRTGLAQRRRERDRRLAKEMQSNVTLGAEGWARRQARHCQQGDDIWLGFPKPREEIWQAAIDVVDIETGNSHLGISCAPNRAASNCDCSVRKFRNVNE
jgi:hypothetical protein